MAERVRITSSLRSGARPVTRLPATDATDESALRNVYLTGLMRAQFRLSATVFLVGSVILGGLPLLFAILPASRRVDIFGIPLPWLLLAIAVYPAAILISQFYLHASERIERQYRDVTAPLPRPTARTPRGGSRR